MNHFKYMQLAAQIAVLKDDNRTYRHGAVGIRNDGVIVCSSNGNPTEPQPRHHAEARVLRKMSKNGTLYVVRVLKDGSWGNSKPCHNCMKRLKSKGIFKVCWSLGWGHSFVEMTL